MVSFRRHFRWEEHIMWKIRVVYSDNSKATITGKHKDISLSLAKKYYQEFVFGKICTATYQQYPMKSHQKMMLLEKIAALEKEVIN